MRPVLKYSKFIFVLMGLFLASCATIINGKHQTIKIETTKDVKLVSLDSSRLKWSNPEWKEYEVLRSRKPLLLNFAVGDTIISYKLRRRLSKEFWLYNGVLYWSGCLVDIFSPKRHAYPEENYFSYDQKRKKILHNTVLPADPMTLKLKFGYSFANVYGRTLFPAFDGRNSITGMNATGELYFNRYISMSLETGVSREGVLKTGGKRRHYYSSINYRDTIYRSAVENYWTALTCKLHYDNWSLGGGFSASLNNYFWRTEYYMKYDTIMQWKNPDGSLNRIDTVTHVRMTHTRSGLVRLLKPGLNFNLERKFNLGFGKGFFIGVNWQYYLADVTTKRLYASHFFNFYISATIANFDLRARKKTNANN